MSQMNSTPPSAGRIAYGVLGALIVAIVLLITAVLPAEYGIDPIGIGRLLGLTEMAQSSEVLNVTDPLAGNEALPPAASTDFGEPVPLPNPQIHQDQDQPARSQTLRISIPAGRETEVKVVLRRNQVFTYSWNVDQGTVYTDFHGHDPAISDTFWVRYKEDQEGSGHNGSLVAPFDGEHGWYWVNHNNFPVTITLSFTGFYDDFVDYGIFGG